MKFPIKKKYRITIYRDDGYNKGTITDYFYNSKDAHKYASKLTHKDEYAVVDLCRGEE